METQRIGLISDTHGLLRPEARFALNGVSRIIHAGDICNAKVLEQLEEIAPVIAVRGNNDRGDWAMALREKEVIEVDGVKIYVVHDLHDLDIDPAAAGIKVIISGHSHKPSVKKEKGVLYVNPGSAGPRRFRLPISLAFLEVTNGIPKAELQTLEVD
ncbi:metallophosphoesterase family protein [Noviherbaspirillum sp. Root189]|uniref:metallophosphoesterase family protein n=1 Tax=Noviherbaspirillum sp. Root189 TaxID=1736487 RepID=UPI00070C3E34|nr:metallophosphoesterase family protein [Noviherbaspirillum sp. Root189]KRB79129.1 phosphodiesterase [Noviherbaspirillum sp. Root189]